MEHRHVKKIGLATVEAGRILLVRKKGTRLFILPGGKPEGSEDDTQALLREVDEELGCGVAALTFEGEFTDVAAELASTVVTIRLYSAALVGDPKPASEIVEFRWLDLRDDDEEDLAPSLRNAILPHLRNSLAHSLSV